MKQRLVGAAILVALIVIIVPELLRGKSPPPTEPSLSLPRTSPTTASGADANAPLRSVTVDMRDPVAAPPIAADVNPPAAQPAPASAATATTLTAPQPPAPAAAPAPARDNAGPPAASPVTPSPARSLPKPAPNGPWVVQLGSFALKVSAERLARELKADGYPAYVSPVRRGARELFRVRVGPLADRQAASSYYTALRAAGKDVAIVPNQ